MQLLGTIDVARRLNCSTENVRYLERTNQLPAERTPSGRRVFKQEDVERLVADRERQRQSKAAKTGNNQQ